MLKTVKYSNRYITKGKKKKPLPVAQGEMFHFISKRGNSCQ